MGNVTIKLAMIDTRITLYQGNFNTKIPYGIDPLDSMIGTIEITIISK